MVGSYYKHLDNGTYMLEFGKHCIIQWVSVSGIFQKEVPDVVQMVE